MPLPTGRDGIRCGEIRLKADPTGRGGFASDQRRASRQHDRRDRQLRDVAALSPSKGRAAVDRPGVIHDPIVTRGLEMRASHEDHQVIGIALAGLPEIQQVARAQRARVAAEGVCC